MRKNKKISVALLAGLFGAFALASCDNQNPDAPATSVVEDNKIENAADKILLAQEGKVVSGDFTVASIVKLDNVDYQVTWTSDNTLVTISDTATEGQYNVHVDLTSNLEEEKTVKLTATVKDADGNTATRTFKIKVPKFALFSLEEYDAASGEVAVKGIVVAKGGYDASLKNGYCFIQDIEGIGGYYGYRVGAASKEAFDTDLAIGNIVILTGKKAIYNGVREFDQKCSYIFVEAGHSNEINENDFTDNILSGDGIGEEYMCQAAKFEGLTVISTDQDKSTDGRWYIYVGDSSDPSKQAKIRINKYLTPVDSADHKAWEDLNIAPGDIINFSGIVNWNNGAELEPVGADAFEIVGHDLGSEVCVLLASKFQSNLPSTIFGNRIIALPQIADLENADAYANYQASWTVSQSNFASVEDNNLEIKLASDETEITVKLTIYSGETIVTSKEFKTKLITNYTLNTQAEVYAIADKYQSGKISSETVVVSGAITGWNSNKKAIYMQNAAGEAYYLYFNSVVDDSMLVVGQQIDIMANVEPYNNQVELVNGVILKTYEEYLDVTPVDMTTEFTTNGFTSLAKDKYYELVTFNATFDKKDGSNWYVKCGDKDILCYSYCSVDDMAAGAPVKVTGLLGFYYNSSKETTSYQIYLVEGQGALEDGRPASERLDSFMNSLKELLAEKFIERTELKIVAPKGIKLEITPPAGSNYVVWNAEDNMLLILPIETAHTDTINVKASIGEESKEENIDVLSQEMAFIPGENLNVTIKLPATANDKIQPSKPEGDTGASYDVAKIGLNANVFTLTGYCNGNSGEPAIYNDAFRLYSGPKGKDDAANGNSMVFAVKDLEGYSAVINSVSFKVLNSYKTPIVLVNNAEVTGVEGVYTINSTSFTIKNTDTTGGQARIYDIVINYSIVANA